MSLPKLEKHPGTMQSTRVCCRGAGSWLLAAWLLFAGVGRAGAELGGDVASVAADRAEMQGTSRIVRMSDGYARHEYAAKSGDVIREYVSTEGTVFAVAWQGPTIPDLRRLLGSYYPEFARAAEAASERHRGPLTIQKPDLVVQSGGHMRAYSGWAYVPGLLPDGVRAGEIR